MKQNNNDDFFYECMPALEAEMLADLPDEQSLHHPFSKKFQKKHVPMSQKNQRSPLLKQIPNQTQTSFAFQVHVSLPSPKKIQTVIHGGRNTMSKNVSRCAKIPKQASQNSSSTSKKTNAGSITGPHGRHASIARR